MTETEYVVYKNDLKYRKFRNLDKEKIKWHQANDAKLYYQDLDSIEYRIKDCYAEELSCLDLKHMDLSVFPSLPNEFYSNVKYLFMDDNNFTELPDLSVFKNLLVVDCSNNKIRKINKLPKTLEEINCHNNKLTELPSPNYCSNLEVLDCGHNEIKVIPNYPKLRILFCGHNQITRLNNCINLEKIYCENNQIESIINCEKLIYLNCKNNKLLSLKNFPNLLDLYCNHNKEITDISTLTSLQEIELVNTNITVIPYFKNLSQIICDNKSIKIAKEYKIEFAKKFDNDTKVLIHFIKQT